MLDVAELEDGAGLHTAVGIIGAGFAGIDLARTLARHGVDVTLLESGRLEFDPATQELAGIDSQGMPIRQPDPDGGFTPYLPPIFRGETRLRQFGGTSNIWTGKWRRFDHLDFSARPWLPFGGWPISRAELDPFYQAVAKDLELADFDAFANGTAFQAVCRATASAGLTPSFHYWQKETLRLDSRYREELARSTRVQVILGANATEILMDDDLEHVRAIGFRSLDGRRFTLEARRFVLAMGGLEVPRLLLASNRQLPNGVGNALDLVGRFYQDHPKHKRGKLRPGPTMKLAAEHAATQPRPRFHLSFSLADRIQEEHGLLHHAIYLRPAYRHQSGYAQEIVEALKAGLRQRSVRRIASSSLALLARPEAASRALERRLVGAHGGRVAHYATAMYVEQAPNPASRVRLGSERDALGMPRLAVDWQATALDHRSFEKVHDALARAFEAAGLGRLDFGDAPLSLADTVDAAHHIGTTRMADHPGEGVVDRNCKVFGTENLFVASSAVFATGHSAAPTLTIMALARRLGEHLAALAAAQN